MEKFEDAEIVIGIVGKIGIRSKRVRDIIEKQLVSLGYKMHHIKLTSHLKQTKFRKELNSSSTEKKYKTYINVCNKIRELTEDEGIFANIAVEKIREIRAIYSENNGPDNPIDRTAYLIDQIKRPEEALRLREIYKDQFVLISCHIDRSEALQNLSARIADDHPASPRKADWETAAAELIEQDQNEEGVVYGQRVREVFPLADLIIDSEDQELSESVVKRFFEALFGNFYISPTRDEFFQNLAYNVALTSCDTARQVGAAIEVNGDVVSTGFNEAPRSGGGTYWAEEGFDSRDIALGKDSNTIRKRQMVMEVVEELKKKNFLSKELLEQDITTIQGRLLDGKKALLKETYIMSTLEYGRSVHAEMSALSCAAKNGTRVALGTVHCTTFPCHNCAKHIVASGISRVVYLEPYPKSFVADLYPDSIAIDVLDEDEDRVAFQQFIGITPRRYRTLFEKSKLKDEHGFVRDWIAHTSSPMFSIDGAQSHYESEIIAQTILEGSLNKTKIKAIGMFR